MAGPCDPDPGSTSPPSYALMKLHSCADFRKGAEHPSSWKSNSFFAPRRICFSVLGAWWNAAPTAHAAAAATAAATAAAVATGRRSPRQCATRRRATDTESDADDGPLRKTRRERDPQGTRWVTTDFALTNFYFYFSPLFLCGIILGVVFGSVISVWIKRIIQRLRACSWVQLLRWKVNKRYTLSKPKKGDFGIWSRRDSSSKRLFICDCVRGISH